MTNTNEPDLTALEGPDDWVSLFLDGAADDMLSDLQLSEFSPESTLSFDGLTNVSHEVAAAVELDRSSVSPQLDQPASSLGAQDMNLPSLDDLLADYPATDLKPDPEGMFSGFQTLDNRDLDFLAPVEPAAAHSHQHSNWHSSNVSARDSQEHTYSAGSNGELPTAGAHLSSGESSLAKMSEQSSPAKPQVAAPASKRVHSEPAQSAAGINSSDKPGQGTSPSLVGMTAAQVAGALGFSAPQRPTPQPAQDISKAPGVSKQPAVRRQANGKKKRSREAESSHAAATTSGASEQQAASIQAAELASRAGSHGVTSSNDASQAQPAQELSSEQSTPEDDEEQKRTARMQRNRESAHQSRQRKRLQMDEVEQRCEQLKQHNSQLNQLVGRLTAENMGLKQQLVHVCHQTGTQLPAPPASALHPFGFGHMGLPLVTPAPKVPIQKMPACRPASVTSSHQSSQHAANVPTSGPPAKARKRAKQVAGAGTVLLALFSFVVFLGPFGPMAGPSGLKSLPTMQGSMGTTQLMSLEAGSMDHHGGRVLMSVGETSLNATDGSALENKTQLVLPFHASSVGHAEQAPLLAEGSGDNGVLVEIRHDAAARQGVRARESWSSSLSSATQVEQSKSIVLLPSNREAESQALQGLKDLAPVVLYSKPDEGFSPARLQLGQSPWQKALPGAAIEEASDLDGFNSPSMCTEVFQFEAQETSAVQATQHVQRYLAGGTSMRGSGSIALPPVTQSQDTQDRPSKRHKATIGCGDDDPGVVVSVMLPTKSEGSPENEFTALDQLYVVVLTPGVKYSTYSCLLPKPVLV